MNHVAFSAANNQPYLIQWRDSANFSLPLEFRGKPPGTGFERKTTVFLRLRSCHFSLGRPSQNELATELPNVRFSKNFVCGETGILIACWHQQVGFAKLRPSITDIPYRINALLSWEDRLSEMVRPTRPPILSPGQTETSRVDGLTGNGINSLTHSSYARKTLADCANEAAAT